MDELRTAATAIKDHALQRLDTLLLLLEERCEARGGVVHWARDAADVTAIVARIAGTATVLPSPVTDELGLAAALPHGPGARVVGAVHTIAETGSLVVAAGAARQGERLVVVAGIEQVLPEWRDLGVFAAFGGPPRLEIWTGPAPGDGPSELHLVLVDNGRAHALADEVGRQALRCVRCGACAAVCPVVTYTDGPSPIDAIFGPLTGGLATEAGRALPYASSLCGACHDVCPVRIDVPEVLVHLRSLAAQAPEHKADRAAMSVLSFVWRHPRIWATAARMRAAEPFRGWWERTRRVR